MGHAVDYSINLFDRFSSTFGKFQSGMDRITRKVNDFGRTANVVNRFSGAVGISGRSIDGLNERLLILTARRNAAFDESDIRRYSLEIRNLQKEMQKLEGMPSEGFFSKFKSGLGGMLPIAGIAAAGFAVAGISRYNQEALEVSTSLESMRNAIKFASVDEQDFAANMAFLRDNIIGGLKMPMMETYEGFRTLSGAMMGTKLQGQGARDIFESVSMGARVMGLSAENTNGVFLALGQMMSKGKVSAEEMNQQLGERLPGALNIAARAMGMSKAELMNMMANGELMAEDFLPKFAQEMRNTYEKGIPEALETTRAKLDDLNNKIITAKEKWAEVFEPINLKLIELRTKGLQLVIDGMGFLKNKFEELKPKLETAGIALAGLTLIVLTFTIAANLNAIAFGIWTIKYYAWLVVTKLVTAAQWLWNTALYASPLTWIIAAVIAFISILVILYIKIDKVRGFIWALWEAIKELGSIIADFFGGLWDAITTGDTSRLKSAFKAGERLSKAWSKGMEAGINDFNADNLQQKLDMLNPNKQGGQSGGSGGGTIDNTVTENISSGGSRPTNITINLGKLQDQIVIHTANLKEGVDEIEKIVTDAMLRVLNSGNVIPQGGGL